MVFHDPYCVYDSEMVMGHLHHLMTHELLAVSMAGQ